MIPAENRQDVRGEKAPEASPSRSVPDAASPGWAVLSLLRAGTRRCRIAAAFVAVVVGLVSQTANQAFAQARETVLYLDAPVVSNERASRAGQIADAYSEPGSPASPETLAWLEVPLRPARVSPPPEEAKKAFASVTVPDGEGAGGVTAEAALEAGEVMLAQLNTSPSEDGEEDENRNAELAASGAIRPELGDGTQAPEDGPEEEAYVAEPAQQPEPEPGADGYGGAGEEPYGARIPDYASAAPEEAPSGGAGLIVPDPASEEDDPGQSSSGELASVPADAAAVPGADYGTEDEPYGPTGPISDTGPTPTEQPARDASGDGDDESAYPEESVPTTGGSELADTAPPPAAPPAQPTVEPTGADTGPTMEQEGETVLVPFSPSEGEEQMIRQNPEPAAAPAPAPTTQAEDGGSEQPADAELPSPAGGAPYEGSGGGPSEQQSEVALEQGRIEDQEDGEDDTSPAGTPSAAPPTEVPIGQAPAQEPAVEEPPAHQTEEVGPPEGKVSIPEETAQQTREASDKLDPGDGSDGQDGSDSAGVAGQDGSQGTPGRSEMPPAEEHPRGEQPPADDASVQDDPAPSQNSGTHNDAPRPDDPRPGFSQASGDQNDGRGEPGAAAPRDQRQVAPHDLERRGDPRDQPRDRPVDHSERVKETDGWPGVAQGNTQSASDVAGPAAERRAERRAQREATNEQAAEAARQGRISARRVAGGQATVEQTTYQQQLAVEQAAQARAERRATRQAEQAAVQQAAIERQGVTEQSVEVPTYAQPAPEPRQWAPIVSQQTETIYQEPVQQVPNQPLTPAPEVQQPVGQAGSADTVTAQSAGQVHQGGDVQVTQATGSIKLPDVGR